VSLQQWQTWINMGLRDPRCPPASPFKSENTLNGQAVTGCFEKPVDCPPGSYKSGPGTNCVAGTPGQGGPAGGGNPGGFPGPSGSPGDVSGQADTLWKEIMNLQSRYSPEVMQRLISGAKSSGAAAGKRAGEAANLDAIRRGLGRSSDAASLAGEASRGAEAAIVNPAVVGYTAEKVKADAEDRIAKLTAMQNWINSARQHIQAMTATANQKEIALANLALMEKRLQQELQMQQNQFDFNMAFNAQQNVGY